MTDAASKPKDAPAKKGKARLLIIAGAIVLLAGGGAGAAFFLKLPPFGGGEASHEEAGAPQAAPPVFVEIPDIVANLNAGARRQSFVRVKARLEVARREDAAIATAAMPRLQDLFTTYLREMRPEELRGSIGTQRLREELLARANLATRPGTVTDVLFVELIVQ
ncbi:flagellar basal body-associated protein FliL [Roseomonas stagni]|uniref:Flagellar protein FliL n=1 Tax=Falsiroseomonas algicola TaxID=2716930 RepID=A0A6M1LNH0_9PROT|nr:flagellar basal body-associated FliL family protein [Falsiroseomonas algicola]NGM21733.1 flagellar basal body-associated protein FliL [Falsiroseomonas algicola]